MIYRVLVFQYSCYKCIYLFLQMNNLIKMHGVNNLKILILI